MKRTLLSLIASFALAGSFVAAQGSPGSQQPGSQQPGSEQPTSPGQRDPSPTPTPSSPGAQSSQQQAPDTTLTGCLVQGSSPSVFILENARTSTDSATSKGKSYIIVAQAGTDLKQHLNHQVRVTGSDAASATPGSSARPGSSSSGSQSSPGASSPGSQSAPGSSSSGSQSSPGSSSSGSQSGSSMSGAQPGASSASRQDDERTMQRFNARTVTMVASTCSAA